MYLYDTIPEIFRDYKNCLPNFYLLTFVKSLKLCSYDIKDGTLVYLLYLISGTGIRIENEHVFLTIEITDITSLNDNFLEEIFLCCEEIELIGSERHTLIELVRIGKISRSRYDELYNIIYRI